MDQSQPDDPKEERCVHVPDHNNDKKHTQEMRATKLTSNQTVCLFSTAHGCVGETMIGAAKRSSHSRMLLASPR